MHDTNYEIGKQAGIFNISINEKGEIFKTEMLPTYIDENKEVKLYKDVDLKDSADYLKRLFVDKTFSKYEISNEDNKLVVELKK